MLADARGKDQRVRATEGRGVGSDVFADAVGKTFQSQFSGGIPFARGFLQIADVAARSGETEKTALAVEHGV